MGTENEGSFKKGKKAGPGRPKGLPNKATQEAREAIALFVNKNARQLDEWLKKVAEGDPENDIKPNPAKAFELFQSVIEYHVPKLARNEHTGKDGGAIAIADASQLTDDQLAQIAANATKA